MGDEKEFDTWRTNEIVCPYCGHEFEESWDYNIGDNDVTIECVHCEEKFPVSSEQETFYYSAKRRDDG